MKKYPMKRKGTRWPEVLLLCLLFVFLLAGCGKGNGSAEKEKLDFTVVEEAEIPEELKSIIEEKKEAEFKLTYTCDGALYLVVGIGKQATGGYSISVKDLYLQDGSICLETESMGPSQGEEVSKTPSYPYIVLKLQYREEPVVFL
ncbi:protease complex subunit PrcB family protein [Lacrimispora sp. NSJ-141]|uniref:Protease complex subunit PrcB family protein n=1 Tax=Lientehia hominis TaxID=2897778 RepID=A0AAP2RHG8_9FIRM|nr:protease complex subunit PrcB family protein [Lientehia hominis]MCD2492314.1 protease complex subunit PrcB family protein [Lientehia hominis]